MTAGERARLLACLAVLAAVGPGASAESANDVATPLQHNPFQRPAYAVAAPAAQEATGRPAVEAKPPLVLTSLLLAGPNSVASINGLLLRIGERIDGYRLAEVKGSRAILIKDGQRLVMEMNE